MLNIFGLGIVQLILGAILTNSIRIALKGVETLPLVNRFITGINYTVYGRSKYQPSKQCELNARENMVALVMAFRINNHNCSNIKSIGDVHGNRSC